MVACHRQVATPTFGDEHFMNTQPSIQRILIPLDKGPFDTSVLAYAELLAYRFDAELLLVSVVHCPPVTYLEAYTLLARTAVWYSDPSAVCEHVWGYLNIQRIRLAQQNIRAQIYVLKGFSIAKVLAEFAQQHAVDIIIQPANTQSQLSCWLYGDTTAPLLRQAPCPILLTTATSNIYTSAATDSS
jgi:nucleotide-binding universal stress UspA family protein